MGAVESITGANPKGKGEGAPETVSWIGRSGAPHSFLHATRPLPPALRLRYTQPHEY